MNQNIENWLRDLVTWLSQDTTESAEFDLAPIQAASAFELESLLGVLEHQFDAAPPQPNRSRPLMQQLAARLKDLCKEQQPAADGQREATLPPDLLARIYARFEEMDHGEAAAHTMQCLAIQQDGESLDELASILGDTPPRDWQKVALGLSPLWHADSNTLEQFFASVGEDFVHPTSMAVLLDLANFATSNKKLSHHPMREQTEQLNSLLCQVVVRLEKLQSDPSDFGSSVSEVQQALNESVALTVSLSHALGLIGDASSENCLLDAMQLSHRQIQAEAAAALAQLGNEVGRARLVQLAEDPSARTRAIAYAEELGMLDEVDSEFQTPVALAESELASWLAAPEQFGIPPTTIELLDSRTQFWPSYEEPQNCFLFRYSYALPDSNVSNIGIAGPLTQAFQADLANLPVEDIYAAFAGWQAEHDEIFEVPYSSWNDAQRREARRLELALEAAGLSIVEPIALTLFFGEVALLAVVEQTDGSDAPKTIAITDGSDSITYPISDHPASLTPEVTLCVFRGRKLLRTFNN